MVLSLQDAEPAHESHDVIRTGQQIRTHRRGRIGHNIRSDSRQFSHFAQSAGCLVDFPSAHQSLDVGGAMNDIERKSRGAEIIEDFLSQIELLCTDTRVKKNAESYL